MANITATELQLLECFGVEPLLLDAAIPWCDNDAAYSVEVDGLSVSFAVRPSYRDVRIVVNFGDRRMLEFNATSVSDLQVIDEPGVDAIEVLMNEQSWLRVQLRPAFAITQGFVAEG